MRVCHVCGYLEASYRWLLHQIWALGVELRFSERAIHTLNHWALSPAMTWLLPKSWRSLISPPVLELCPFRYPNTACELLTCDVPQISDRLGEDESLLNLLYDFLDQEPPLNPLLASFFSKTIGNLIARKTEQVMICEAKCIGQSLLPLWNCHQALETAFCLLNRPQMNSISGWYVNCCLSKVTFQRGFVASSGISSTSCPYWVLCKPQINVRSYNMPSLWRGRRHLHFEVFMSILFVWSE